MTDKEFRRLSRSELVEVIYELQKNQQELKNEKSAREQENAELKDRLESRELRLSQAGSIAEATVELSGIFEAAQKAADDYLAQIKADNEDSELKCAQMIAEAEEEAERVLNGANEKVEEKWLEFREKTDAFMRAHDELKMFLEN